jgi:hypothetical protein
MVADHLGMPVRPLIAVHGSGMRSRGGRCEGVRVVPAAKAVRFVRRRRRRLRQDQIATLARRADSLFPQMLGKKTARRG